VTVEEASRTSVLDRTCPNDVDVRPMTAPDTTSVHGAVEPGFEGVRAVFEDDFAVRGDFPAREVAP
jgi:hypothetical protein